MKKLNFSEVAAILFAAFFTVSFVAGCGDNQGGNQSENQVGNQGENQGGGNQQGGGAKFANYKTVVSGLSITASGLPGEGVAGMKQIGTADMKTHDGGFAHPGDTMVFTSEGKEAYAVNYTNNTLPSCPVRGFSNTNVPRTPAVEKAESEGRKVYITESRYGQLDELCK